MSVNRLGVPLRIVIHHSASPRSTTYEQVDAWHRARRPVPFRMFGYHFFIGEDGLARIGRPIPELGAHIKGRNAGSIGILVTGDNTEARDRWNLRQVEGLRLQVAHLVGVWPFLSRSVEGHKDLDPATACPGLDVRALLAGSRLIS